MTTDCRTPRLRRSTWALIAALVAACLGSILLIVIDATARHPLPPLARDALGAALIAVMIGCLWTLDRRWRRYVQGVEQSLLDGYRQMVHRWPDEDVR